MIRAFDAEHPALTLSEVARACELTRAAARRFLLTLADLGYVHTDGRRFRLTPRVLELGYSYLAGYTLPSSPSPIWSNSSRGYGNRRRSASSTATTSCTSPGSRPAAS
ncbi:hypothetical protein SVIOM74S_01843 [Streptomyces violarus]